MSEISKSKKAVERGSSHMPDDSVFYEKIVPALLVVLGAVTVVLVIFAACVLFGIVRF